MKTKVCKILSLVLTVFTVFFSIYVPVSAENNKIFEGKTISVLGDSISTFKNISNGTGADTTNSTIRDYVPYYANGKYGMTVNDTWWGKTALLTGADILVNNSYGGSKVFYPSSKNASLGYISRCVNLHDNTGDNKGEKPDIIAVYLGTNDFTHCKEVLGTSDIDYSTLITKTNGRYNYKTPKSTCEAYAIMLHKIKVAYPDAEIYCFTVLPRLGLTDTEIALLESFNENIKAIASYNKCFVADIYSNSGLTYSKANINRYIGDGHLHPNKLGMSAIANTFLSSIYKNSSFLPSDQTVYNISYNLDCDVIVNEGTKKATLGQESFSCSFSKLSYGNLTVSVKMNGEDITETAYKNGKITIPAVNGNIEITADVETVERSFNSYRFETVNVNDGTQLGQVSAQELINVKNNENTKNTIAPVSGEIQEGYVYSGEYVLDNDLELFYDKPWSLVWHTEYSEESSPIVFSENEDSLSEGNHVIHIQNNTSILALGVYRNGSFHNIGIDLSKYNINTKEAHTYKLTNVYNADGTNTVTLFVDGVKIGALNKYYIDDVYQGVKKDGFFETDFLLKFIGTSDNLLNGCKLSYIQVWETAPQTNHTHNHSYVYTSNATCTASGIKKEICDCGSIRETQIEEALGHRAIDWVITITATVSREGIMEKECSRCGDVVATKKIPQKKCAAPKPISAKNTNAGVLFTWKKTTGADTYRVYRKEAGKGWVYLNSVTSSESSYTDKTAKSGKSYYYTVIAANKGGYSSYYSGVFTLFLSTPKLKTVKNTGNAINVAWSKVSGAKYYKIYKKTGSGQWEYIGKTTALSFNDTKVSSGKTYSYTVKAVNGNYKSGHYTSGLTITRLTAPKLNSVASTKKGVAFKWSKTPYASGYIVYRKAGNGSFTRLATIKNPNTLVFVDKTAKKGVTYTYTVKAYRSSSYSTYYAGLKIKDKY